MSIRIKAIVGLVVVVLFGIVALQNSGPVNVRFLLWGASVDALFLYVLLFVGGAVVGVLGTLALRRRKPRPKES